MNPQLNICLLLLALLFLLIMPGPSHAIDTSRPGQEKGPTEVQFRVYIIDVDEITDAEQSFTANIFMQSKWIDERLIQPGKTVKYSLNEVWNPNLQILNRQKTFKTLPDIVVVSPDGTAVYNQRVTGKFSQPLDLHNFPLDEQTLKFQIVSVGNTTEDIKLVEETSGIAEKFSLPNWQIRDWGVELKQFSFVPDIPPVTGLTFSITAKRYYHFYVFKFIVPLLLIVFMSWIVFWIDPADYTTQISVSITSMLTLIAYQYLVGSSLPQVPYLTRLDMLMFLSTALVFASLIEVTITSVLTKRDQVGLARRIDYYCRYIFPVLFVVIALIPLI